MVFSDVAKTFNNYHLKNSKEEFSFYFKSNPIKLESKLKDIGVKNIYLIEVKTNKINNDDKLENTPIKKLEETPGNTSGDNNDKNFYNITFDFNSKMIMIHATKDTEFCDLVKKFYIKIGSLSEKPIFICNSKLLNSDDHSTLKDLNLVNNQKINVVLIF
mgnify:CR=1 FL=1